ncbi:MAG: hypothetical protein DRI23_05785 [Candidatus Cloacimonadota bacterium]|nr:MAG: hypothetical protein DRI23_05785 [Candidatus Cloacimonadota bacterium]
MSRKKHNPKRTFLLILSLLILNLSAAGGFFTANATVRYVSHNGSNTPPYTSWATAADSIMSAINISVFGDTIYIANGVYKERIDMIDGLTLIGGGMDSCVIDSREFNYVSGFYTVEVFDSCSLSHFRILTYDITHGDGIVITSGINSMVEYCRIQEAKYGIIINAGHQNKPMVYKNIILDVTDGITTVYAQSIIKENIIYPKEDGLVSQINSAPTYISNTIVINDGANLTFGYLDWGLTSKLKNNFFYSLDNSGTNGIYSFNDTIINNFIYGEWASGINSSGSVIKNNHIEKTHTALRYAGGTLPIAQYNNLWNNQTNFQNFSPDSTNIYHDPMFVNPDSLDFHLQMFSPLIDAGDPNILDIDGSRSDIGLFGGPYGEIYTYRDLAPKPPSNLTAEYDSGLVKLTWNKNTEADFYRYRVYRDTVPNFMYDTTKIIAVVADTFYYDAVPEKFLAGDYYYKITALDSTGHQSAPSEEVHINITGIPEAPPVVVEHYQLLNNYPNPFNSSTVIPYRLKEAGYVKLYVYDIKGELVITLINEYQSAGYYEARFSPTREERKSGEFSEGWWTGYNDDIATGIYIYQIMVRGERNIPVFTDMGKMILLK